jgi:hypothetical protein
MQIQEVPGEEEGVSLIAKSRIVLRQRGRGKRGKGREGRDRGIQV